MAGATEALFPAITGGWFTMFMAVFSYVGDITTVEERTLRIGVVNVFVSLGVPIGMALSGVLYARIGFYGVFSTAAVLYVLSIGYGLAFIKEPGLASCQNNGDCHKSVNSCEKTAANECKAECEIEAPESPTYRSFLRDFFDVRHIAETFRVAFKTGERNRRSRVIMLMLVVMVVIGPLHGTYSKLIKPI